MTPQLLEERVRTLTRPSLAAAEDAITDAIERGALLTAVGRCTVEYDGRAASTLGAGDRHLMIKPDGTVMVHTDEGRQPVNWQPPGCTCAVERDGDGGPNDRRTGDGRIEDGRSETGGADDRLVIRSTRSSPDEALSVSFERVFQVSAFDLTDEAELALTGTHEDLRRRVLADPDLVEPGVSPIATERDTAAGAVDIYGEDADGNPVVLELKRSRAGPDAVGQLDRYVAAVDREPDVDGPVRGVLVAPSATDRARRMLEERRLEFVALEPEADGRR
ncbi:endonuclease NucS [Halovivax limisalsi]|uniref:endonuclease NucS n=1 Tax=Halovivax limisalsi TaxID=1453760 RepID=UPI001FFD4045|nr:endonuclease NucS [Halovivax limisalsi]